MIIIVVVVVVVDFAGDMLYIDSGGKFVCQSAINAPLVSGNIEGLWETKLTVSIGASH